MHSDYTVPPLPPPPPSFPLPLYSSSFSLLPFLTRYSAPTRFYSRFTSLSLSLFPSKVRLLFAYQRAQSQREPKGVPPDFAPPLSYVYYHPARTAAEPTLGHYDSRNKSRSAGFSSSRRMAVEAISRRAYSSLYIFATSSREIRDPIAWNSRPPRAGTHNSIVWNSRPPCVKFAVSSRGVLSSEIRVNFPRKDIPVGTTRSEQQLGCNWNFRPRAGRLPTLPP